MRAWHFSETAYPYLPPADTYPSIRVSLPNRIYDPAKGAAVKDFLGWMLDHGESEAAGMGYAPLPAQVQTMVRKTITTVK